MAIPQYQPQQPTPPQIAPVPRSQLGQRSFEPDSEAIGTSESSGADPTLSLQAQRERAERFGHHFSQVSILSSHPTPIQAQFAPGEIKPQISSQSTPVISTWIQRLRSPDQKSQQSDELPIQAQTAAGGEHLQRQSNPGESCVDEELLEDPELTASEQRILEQAQEISARCLRGECVGEPDDQGIRRPHISAGEYTLLFEAAAIETGVPARLLKAIAVGEAPSGLHWDGVPRHFIDPEMLSGIRAGTSSSQLGINNFAADSRAQVLGEDPPPVSWQDDRQNDDLDGDGERDPNETVSFGMMHMAVPPDQVTEAWQATDPQDQTVRIGGPAGYELNVRQTIMDPYCHIKSAAEFLLWKQENTEGYEDLDLTDDDQAAQVAGDLYQTRGDGESRIRNRLTLDDEEQADLENTTTHLRGEARWRATRDSAFINADMIVPSESWIPIPEDLVVIAGQVYQLGETGEPRGGAPEIGYTPVQPADGRDFIVVEMQVSGDNGFYKLTVTESGGQFSPWSSEDGNANPQADVTTRPLGGGSGPQSSPPQPVQRSLDPQVIQLQEDEDSDPCETFPDGYENLNDILGTVEISPGDVETWLTEIGCEGMTEIEAQVQEGLTSGETGLFMGDNSERPSFEAGFPYATGLEDDATDEERDDANRQARTAGSQRGFRLDWDTPKFAIPGAENDPLLEVFNSHRQALLEEEFGSGVDLSRVLVAVEMARRFGADDGVTGLQTTLFRIHQYAVVETLNVGEHGGGQRYAPQQNGDTFCNVYAYDVVLAMGGYIPRSWWGADIPNLPHPISDEHPPTMSGGAVQLNANSLHQWMLRYGADFGWQSQEIGSLEGRTVAQDLANSGRLVIILARNNDSQAPGHVSVVLAESARYQARRDGDRVFSPLQSQAGSDNFRYSSEGSEEVENWDPEWWMTGHEGAAFYMEEFRISPVFPRESLGL